LPKFLKFLLVAAWCVLLAAGPVFAQTLEGAMADYQAGNYEDALKSWQTLAASGDTDALFNLGQMYRLGQGIRFDFPRAEESYLKAAEAGHTAAQRELGNLYFFSIGTEEAQAKAIPWWSQAAMNGDPKAQYILGILNFNGDVVPKDRVKGYAWTLLAMDGGVPEALQSNTAMRGQLSADDQARALTLASQLMTGVPHQGLYSNLIGEPFPRPRAIIPGVKTAEGTPKLEPAPVIATQNPEPLDLEVRQPVVENEALPALTENSKTFDEVQSVEDPSVMETTEEAEPEEDLTPDPVVEGPPILISEEDYDLGDPLSPLVDSEGFDGAWSIQLTSFRKPENAEAHWQEVLKAHPDLFALVTKKILRFDLGPERGVYYRLRIGPFLDKEEADAKCLEITEAGLGCLVIWP